MVYPPMPLILTNLYNTIILWILLLIKLFIYYYFLFLSTNSIPSSYMQFFLLDIYYYFYYFLFYFKELDTFSYTLAYFSMWQLIVSLHWWQWSHDWIVDVFFVVALADTCLGIWASLFFPHFVVFNVEILTLWVFAKWRVTKGLFFQ